MKQNQNNNDEVIKRYDDFDCSKQYYAKYEKELKKFFAEVKLPKNLEAFLNSFKSSKKKSILMPNGKSYLQIHKVWAFSNLLNKNFKFLNEDNDYFKQFKDVVIFGLDEYGHGYFFLSFEENKKDPKVIFIDYEIDKPILLANNFDEFLDKLKTQDDPQIDEIDEKNNDIISYGKKKFNFQNFPQLEEKYNEWSKLRRVYRRNVNQTNRNKLNQFEIGEISKLVFDTFNGKVKLLFTEKHFITTWKKIFGNDFDKLDDNQKRCLTYLLEGDFVYRLPPKYYKKQK